ncbi:sulfotransferase domain-containing protein [Oceanibium sediminis]|uniref:sulfotransferase domain-containing protein n=1 Tax=Oceanibium sediminis TaxID=2026339 RepID=UPI000DD38BE6|nr:sulfotransferase domain-containing protein [Oceanibium sediminis]
MNDMHATRLREALTRYSGEMTQPDRWSAWTPREGDILVSTPPKCGTTWTQTILAMLLHGGTDLPERVSVLSPWIDSRLGADAEVAESLRRQPGRRVVKTHTPPDGFPVWEGVHTVVVYRHPLDVFFSLRNHIANRRDTDGHVMRATPPEALEHFLTNPMRKDDIDQDSLANVTWHYLKALARRGTGEITFLHYADMLAEPERAVATLARIAGVGDDAALIRAITAATRLDAMRADAARFAPEGGAGFWVSDSAFFASGGTRNWQGKLSAAEIASYDAALAALIPDTAARRWLEHGTG